MRVGNTIVVTNSDLTGVVGLCIFYLVHPFQRKLLELAETDDLGQMSYYSLAKKLGSVHPNNAKFHIEQLIKKGLLVRNRKTRSISLPLRDEKSAGLLAVPVMGEANCGVPVSIADGRVKYFLRFSPSSVNTTNLKGVFALLAKGNSMNMAKIQGESIEDGDYVLVRSGGEQVIDGDYVVSLIDETANIKRLTIDRRLNRYLLVSESSEPRPPIIIDSEDYGFFTPLGKVVEVIKGIGG